MEKRYIKIEVFKLLSLSVTLSNFLMLLFVSDEKKQMVANVEKQLEEALKNWCV